MLTDARSRVTVVVLSYNRSSALARTVEHLLELPEHPPVIVVDNGSRDGSPEAIERQFPSVKVIRLPRNIGTGARNVGARAADTPYIAFCDDDTFWLPGSLGRACELLDRSPKVGVLSAKVLVGPNRREDPICRKMRDSPLPARGLPGPALLGFMAGAAVFRRTAFFAAGGYERRFMIGGEEALLALDIVTLHWAIVFADDVLIAHYPAARNGRARRRTVLRNELWTAWLRRPLRSAVRRSFSAIAHARHDDAPVTAAVLSALAGLPWVLHRRRVVPPRVETLCRLLERGRGARSRRERRREPRNPLHAGGRHRHAPVRHH